MRKTFFLWSVILLFTFTSFLIPSSVYADEGWQIYSFDSQITLESDGDVNVIETISVKFDEAKHGIYRELPLTYNGNGTETGSEISVNTVSMDQSPIEYEETENRANLQLKIGDPDRTITGTHMYILDYSVKGILRSFGSYDELYWNVTGHNWPVPIQKASATVRLPQPELMQSACYEGPVGAAIECQLTSIDATTVEFSAKSLMGVGEGMTIAVGFTPGIVPIVTVTPPQSTWQAVKAWPSVTALLLTLGVGFSLLTRKWLEHGRDKWYGHKAAAEGQEVSMPFGMKESIAPEFASPNGLRPAELGTLVDEKADTLDVTATIVDLASRGYLTITEIPKKWRFGSNDYSLKQLKKPDEKLLNYEKKLIDALFDSGEEVKLSDLKNSFYKDLAKVKASLYDNVVKKGLFAKSPETIRNNYIGAGIGILILGVFILILGINVIISVLIGLGSGLILLGIVTMITSNAMPARTAKGRHLYRQARGYELFINTAEKHRAQFAEKENLFTELLPYAIVFGATQKLAKAMDVLGIQPAQPTWYHGVHPFHAAAFANDVNNFSSTLSTAMASTPSSSGSGGGGSSGGGFGGGGGGSW